ncbi:MAG: hypothetical protein ED557_14215 [Balneola sp.]|nr:MAG: hypothetical protein ED557_14215 [Balneola sp.]
MKLCLPFILLILVLGCSTAPDFERDNPNDPRSEDFVPNRPNNGQYTIDNNGNITLTWRDNTQFETAVNIYKQVAEYPREKIAVLPKDLAQYTDTTREFGFPTTYFISSEKDTSESNLLAIDIDFGSFNSFSHETRLSSNELRFFWYDEISFKDGYLLVKKTDNDLTYETVKIISGDLFETTIPIPESGFSHEFKIRPFKVFRGDTTTITPTNTSEFELGPLNLRTQLIAEDSLLISWQENSEFEDSFLLSITTPNGLNEIELERNSTSYTFNELLSRDFNYRFSLVAKNGEVLSRRITSNRSFELSPPAIQLVTQNSSTEIVIHITEPSEIRRTIDVYRSLDNISFTKVGTILKNEDSFTDNNLNQFESYYYYLSSSLSTNSFTKKIISGLGLKEVNNIEFDDIFFSFQQFELTLGNASPFIAYTDWGSSSLEFFDFLEEGMSSSITIPLPINELAVNSDHTSAVATNTVTNKIYLIDLVSSIVIDSINVDNLSRIYPRFINEGSKIAALFPTDDTYSTWDLSVIDLTTKSIESVDIITSPSSEIPDMYVNPGKTRMVVSNYFGENDFELAYYSISNGMITDENNTYKSWGYPISFSNSLDSVMAVTDQYELTIYDSRTSQSIFNYEFTLYNSSNLRNSFFLKNGIVYVPDQAGAYLVDINRFPDDPIVEIIGFNCCSISHRGSYWFNDSGYLIDLRNSHISGTPNFGNLYELEEKWKISLEEID